MSINTKDLTKNKKISNREKKESLKEKHQPLFHKEKMADLCGDTPKFIPRMAYMKDGELIIGFYQREIYGGTDIYTEFVSRDYEPEDTERRLYKWIYNPEYATEYKLSDAHKATGDRMVLIPVDELINVDEYHIELEKQQKEEETSKEEEQVPFTLGKEDADIPYDSMTIRDYCAIKWKKPVSQRGWLNSLITNTFKNE
tara:strand:+ start:1218 stop:1814 length:597 start_codon:yes stop_codon:yes gene_type:complete